MLRVDVGCGPCKQPGFLGLDRYALPGVDIVADLNGPLPFRDDSVELLLASHSLEHVSNILKTMREIYRICEHGAQLCVIAPYSEQKLNLANPYHTTVFNEHTPRFWTSWPHVTIDPEEFAHPHAESWGLSRSDHSDPGIDIRLVGLEYFYFPQYIGLSPEEQRSLRRDRVDVCDQILYHLIVWKGDHGNPTKSFDEYVTDFTAYEPEFIRVRRKRDEEVMAGSAPREELVGEIARYGTLLHELRLDLHQQRTAVATTLEESLDLRNRLLEAKSTLATARAENLVLIEARIGILRERDQALARGEVLSDELAALRHLHANDSVAAEKLKEEILSWKALLASLRVRETSLAGELAAAREARADIAETAARLKQELADAKSEVNELRASTAAMRIEWSDLIQKVATLQTNVASNDVLKAKAALVQAELQTVESLLAVERMQVESLSFDLAAARGEAHAAAQNAARLNAHWTGARRSLDLLCSEARGLPATHLIRAGRFYVAREMQLPPAAPLSTLRDYSDHHWDTAKAFITLSEDLNRIPYQEYVVPFDLDRLLSVSFAIRPLVVDSPGTCGIEIVSAESVILAQTELPLAPIRPEQVTEFSLAVPLHGLKKNWLLRIFVRDAVAPVPIYELVRGSRRAPQFFPLVLFR